MERLFEEILTAKKNIIDIRMRLAPSKNLQTKRGLLLMNLKHRVEERLSRRDFHSKTVKQRELAHIKELLDDLHNDFYSGGL